MKLDDSKIWKRNISSSKPENVSPVDHQAQLMVDEYDSKSDREFFWDEPNDIFTLQFKLKSKGGGTNEISVNFGRRDFSRLMREIAENNPFMLIEFIRCTERSVRSNENHQPNKIPSEDEFEDALKVIDSFLNYQHDKTKKLKRFRDRNQERFKALNGLYRQFTRFVQNHSNYKKQYKFFNR